MHHTTMAPAPQNHKFALKLGKLFPHVHKFPQERFRNRVNSPVNWFAGSTIEPSNRRVCLPGGALPTMIAKVPPFPNKRRPATRLSPAGPLSNFAPAPRKPVNTVSLMEYGEHSIHPA